MKILLCGFFGEGNLGDDTIAAAIRAQLPDHVSLTITSAQPLTYGGQAIRRRGLLAWPAFIKAAATSRAAIFSGGLLQDWSFEGVTFFALRILAASALGCEPTLWGAGLGPLRSPGSKKLATRALKRIKTVWLRDQGSQLLYQQLMAASAGNGTDWSWSFPVKTTTLRDNAPLVLNLRQWPDGAWREQVAHQLRHNQRQIFGLAARRSDIEVIRQLAPTASIIQPASFAEFANSCQNFSAGLAMRYHAALAMLRARLPVKFIDYDNKVSELAQAAGITTLAQNQISDFKIVDPAFIVQQEQQYADMQQAFNDWAAKLTTGKHK